MAVVSTNGQSFSVDGRRLWLVGAQLDYARMPASTWASRLHTIKESGFNTVQTACPWLLHEPRKGQFNFKDQGDIAHFCALAAEAGLHVVLQVGPSIGRGYDGGGLPHWLTLESDVLVRSGVGLFMQHATTYLSRLINQISDLQITKGGPVVAVQVEHAWQCSNEDESARYLGELIRFVRESGIAVPITNANDLWAADHDSIHTWRSQGQHLGHLRQLRVLQPEVPRLVTSLPLAEIGVSTEAPQEVPDALDLQSQIAEVLAAGGQFILDHIHGGTNFGFLGGRFVGQQNRFAATSVANAAPMSEAGIPTDGLAILRRITTFASTFSHVFSHLDPNFQPVASTVRRPSTKISKTQAQVSSIVTQSGSGGTVVFAFANGIKATTELLLPDGNQLPIDLGEQLVGWYLLNTDLCGAGRLDYANVCPLTVIDRKIAVFFGSAGSPAHLSIDGRPLQAIVPTGLEPLMVDHEDVIVVICNEKQVDATVIHGNQLYCGAAWTSSDGTPRLGADWKEVIALSVGGKETLPGVRGSKRSSRAMKPKEWFVNAQDDFVSGQSPRFASLNGPSDLITCGSPEGYGWYRINSKVKSSRTHTCMVPQGGDRLAWYLDGTLQCLTGVGPGATPTEFDLQLTAGNHTLVVLADNLGRLDGGNELHEVKGIGSHLYEVKKLSGVKQKTVQAEPISPFDIRPNIFGLGGGDQSVSTQFTWAFEHAKKAPLIVDIQDSPVSGSLLLNDEPLIYYPGDRGISSKRIVISLDSTNCMKRGKNVLRFAPDPRQENTDQICKSLRILESVGQLGDGNWAFARWEGPDVKSFDQTNPAEAAKNKGTPCWWRAEFGGAALSKGVSPLWCDVGSMSKGQLYFNGNNVGRYFNAQRDGKEVDGQSLLSIPEAWINTDSPNELMLFDEHGFSPFDVNLVRREFGSRDA